VDFLALLAHRAAAALVARAPPEWGAVGFLRNLIRMSTRLATRVSISHSGLRLRIQVFTSGFAVMALELLGSRLVTPIFGSSIWTWGSLIGVVLAGLASGYRFGGWIADRSPSPRKFSMIVFVGGILVLLVPFIAPYALSVSQYAWLGDEYGPLLGTVLILLLPTFVLGMTSPYAIKLASQTLSSLGNVSGTLYSLSTVGSIAGTFGTVFILIPLWDVRLIILALGLAVIGVSMLWLPKSSALFAVLIFLVVSTSFARSAPQVAMNNGSTIYEKQTPYSTLDVVDVGNVRTLFLNGIPQSSMYLNDSTKLVYFYTTFFNLGMQINPNATHVLFVGGGGFSGPKFFLATYPHVHVDVAEIDPDVIDTDMKYFAVSPNPRLTIFNEDGRVYLSETSKTYDIIILDAYAKSYIPFQLLTQQFIRLVASHLNGNGIVISNIVGSLDGSTSNLARAEDRTATDVLNNSAVFRTSDTPSIVQNLLLVLSSSPTPLAASVARLNASDSADGVSPTGGYSRYLYPLRLEGVPILTDGYAPVESLINPLTGSPYVIEQEFGRLAPVTSSYDLESIGGLLIIGIAWFAYTLRVNRDYSATFVAQPRP
jgi:spermidine synthase